MRSLAVVVVAVALSVLASGCKKSASAMDLPMYPTAGRMGGGGTWDKDTHVLHKVVLRSPDNVGSVKRFYEEELTRRGFERVSSGQGISWSKNMVMHGEEADVVDSAQEGGFVAVVESNEETRIYLFQAKPKGQPAAQE